MELRVLRYFLAVAQAESISGAAEQLHLTQPTLSRQLIDLETSTLALDLPDLDIWGVIMRTDAPLAKKERIQPKDLWDKPLIWPRQTTRKPALPAMLATYSHHS